MINIMDGSSSPSGKMPYTTYFANYTTGQVKLHNITLRPPPHSVPVSQDSEKLKLLTTIDGLLGFHCHSRVLHAWCAWPVCVSNIRRDIREGDLQAGSGTTYWWMKEPVLFPFGSGLEYTTFSFSWGNTPPSSASPSSAALAPLVVDIPAAADAEEQLQLLQALSIDHSVVVTNTGTRASPVVVLAFIVATADSPPDTPIKKLFGFERVANVEPGQNATVHFASDAASLGVVGATGARLLMAGRYRIEIGSVTAQSAVRELELRGDSNAVVEENSWAQAMAAGRL